MSASTIPAESPHPGGQGIKGLDGILRVLQFAGPKPEVLAGGAYSGKIQALPVTIGMGVAQVAGGAINLMATLSASGRSVRSIPHESRYKQ